MQCYLDTHFPDVLATTCWVKGLEMCQCEIKTVQWKSHRVKRRLMVVKTVELLERVDRNIFILLEHLCHQNIGLIIKSINMGCSDKQSILSINRPLVWVGFWRNCVPAVRLELSFWDFNNTLENTAHVPVILLYNKAHFRHKEKRNIPGS